MRYFFLILILPLCAAAQGFRRPLTGAGSFFYKQHCYVYGFGNERSGLTLKVYRLSHDLKRCDSLSVPVGKDKVENYLEISADTLHNYLNFYLQKANSKNLASMVRLSDSLTQVAAAENFDVTKVNRLMAFEDEKYWYGNSVYTVRTATDTSGKQYYLNRYDVADAKKPFEYKDSWQFPYEKHHIHTVHVFYADSQIVLTYVTILSGLKKGQWIVKLNAENGQLIKGVKLNPKNDVRAFLMSGFHYDKKKKKLLVAGTIYSEAQLNYGTNSFTFNGLDKSSTFFFVSIDSLGENVIRNEKSVPLPIANLKPDPKKISFLHPKIKELNKKSAEDYITYCDLYSSNGQDLMFRYETGFYFSVTQSEMEAEMKMPEKLYSNTIGLTGLVTSDIKDLNGKMDLKSISDMDKFVSGKPLADVESVFSKDENGNPKWILKKSDIKTGNTTFYMVKVGPKGIESKTILESSKYNHPAVYKASAETLLLFNSESASFELKAFNW